MRDGEQSRAEGLNSGRRLPWEKENMRGISKAMLRTTVGLAVGAALVVGGAGVASAAPVSPAAHTTSSAGSSCNRFAREQWNLNGSNHVEAVYQGSTYTYSVTFRQSGSPPTGILTDPYFPTTGRYPGRFPGIASCSASGIRAIPSREQGPMPEPSTGGEQSSGPGPKTGSQGGGGTFTLARNAHRA